MALVAERSPGGGRGRAGADRSSGGRPLRARRPVPSGRSVLGALLVAAAAVLVFTAWLGTTSPAGRPWVVAARPLAQGTRLAAGDLSVSSMQLAPATAAGGFARPGALSGRVLDAPLAPGNLVTRADLVPAGGQAALRPVALGVDPSEAAPLSVGGLVDVLVTTGSGPSAQTAVVTRGARLISLAAPASTLGASSGAEVVVLGVASFGEVTAVVHAERTGTISVVAGEPSDGAGLGPAAPPPGGP